MGVSACSGVRLGLYYVREIQRSSLAIRTCWYMQWIPAGSALSQLESLYLCMRCSGMLELTGCDFADQLSAIWEPADAGAGPDRMPRA